MKKIILVLLALLPTLVFAQEIQFQASKNTSKIAIENLEVIDRYTIYAYGESSISDITSTYMQVFFQYRMIEHLGLHVEYRAFLPQGEKISNTFFCGLSIPIVERDWIYFSVTPLYRYDCKHQWQASFTYGANYKNLTFDGYFDLYGDRDMFAFSENKIKIHFNELFFGANIEFMMLNKWSKATPYIMIGLKF